MKKTKDSKYTLTAKNYYETDGIFCSFNCCMSYIEDNTHNALYDQSKHLLHQLFFRYFKKVVPIKPAPDWRLLKEIMGERSAFKNLEKPLIKLKFKN